MGTVMNGAASAFNRVTGRGADWPTGGAGADWRTAGAGADWPTAGAGADWPQEALHTEKQAGQLQM